MTKVPQAVGKDSAAHLKPITLHAWDANVQIHYFVIAANNMLPKAVNPSALMKATKWLREIIFCNRLNLVNAILNMFQRFCIVQVKIR